MSYYLIPDFRCKEDTAFDGAKIENLALIIGQSFREELGILWEYTYTVNLEMFTRT